MTSKKYKSCIGNTFIRDCFTVPKQLLKRIVLYAFISTFLCPSLAEFIQCRFVQVFHCCSRTNATRKIKSCLCIDFSANFFWHRNQTISLIPPRNAISLHRKAKRSTSHFKYQDSFSAIVIKLEIDHDTKLFHQSFAGSFRLIKSVAANNLSGTFVRYAEYQFPTTTIREGTAALESLVKSKAILRFLKLNTFTFFGF